MAGRIVPSYRPGPRSSTAVPDVVDDRDEDLYSSGVIQDGAQSDLVLFKNPIGQQIPRVAGQGVVAPLNSWQQTHSNPTTNLDKAGELGDSIGDVKIRAIHLSPEQAPITPSTGAYPAVAIAEGNVRTWGASGYELQQLADLTAVELKVSKKPYFMSTFKNLPSIGAPVPFGAGTFAAGNYRGQAVNSSHGLVRKLGNWIACSRRDSLQVNISFANGFAMAGRVAGSETNDGTPFLVQCVIPAWVNGDAR